jgi:tetratricopeptide (TPR) repeat protein
MIGAGYLGVDTIGHLVDEVNYQFLGGVREPRSVDDQLAELRDLAGNSPASPETWLRYADFAYERRRYADAIVGYNHLLSLRPDDARVLNSLAWLHCTAAASWARDPVRALELAERAYALDPSPSITDTLAEAAFLNGNVARAIALEEEALSRVRGNDRFYREQLAKFRAAAERMGQGVPTAESAESSD